MNLLDWMLTVDLFLLDLKLYLYLFNLFIFKLLLYTFDKSLILTLDKMCIFKY